MTPASQMPRAFKDFDDFFLFYLTQHSNPANRVLHACGTLTGLAIVVATFALGHYWWALLWLPVGYGFAWVGHLAIEGNKPATWGHPLWSFLGDFRMLGLMLTGRLGAWLERARRTEAVPADGPK